MPDPQANKVELSVKIQESELLSFLLSRYNQEDLAAAGIRAPSSIIRSMVMEEQGVCEFRICSMSLINVEALLEETQGEQANTGEALMAQQQEESGGDGVPPEQPPMQGHAIKIRKSKKGSN
jgi:hypothetical protein